MSRDVTIRNLTEGQIKALLRGVNFLRRHAYMATSKKTMASGMLALAKLEFALLGKEP